MADDILNIIWELEEWPDPQLESCIDWTRAHGMMSTSYALFAEGRNLRYKLEERLMGDDDKEDENWQENGAQEDKVNSGVNTDNNNNNDYNNNSDSDNDNNNGLSDNNNDNNNINNNNDFNNNNNKDSNNGHSDNDVSINNNNNNVNNYINNDEDYNSSDDHGSSDAVGIGADNNNNADGDNNNNNCDDGGSGDGGGSDDGDRDVGIGDDNRDGDDNNNNRDGDDNNNNRDGDDNNNNYEDGGNDDSGGRGDDGSSNDHGSSMEDSISTTGKKAHADEVGSVVDTDKRKKELQDRLQQEQALLAKLERQEAAELEAATDASRSTFQTEMHRIFRPYLDKFMVVYLDDILIFSRTARERTEHLALVLQSLRDSQYKINREKSSFGVSSVIYLGHVISGDGLAHEAAKIVVVQFGLCLLFASSYASMGVYEIVCV
ncbi:hypothetical protein CBR_g51071 [Chara braunii]|uniref:Reverse transcriptase domain-containing protein n=1 Tax=Chara braunii TaxID=69332 RepID=A0A388K630_CHABU|nr:hypothetical protein CBR_g51071 [Chara braunii]|eukprot:GBG65476.1 hypothetical protein CBR_g51071 [Chara braunii]